jgi:hypothetical protein
MNMLVVAAHIHNPVEPGSVASTGTAHEVVFALGYHAIVIPFSGSETSFLRLEPSSSFRFFSSS